MGIDQNFYVGPFVKSRETGTIRTETVRFCSGDSSHARGAEIKNKDAFCSSCGSQIIEQLQTFPGELRSTVSAWDVATEFDELLTHISGMCDFGDKLTDYWISNRNNDGMWSLDLEMYTTTLQEISPEIIVEGKQKFADHFAPELEILRKHYASVEICWGVLGWCS
jgi:hypothetical protein